jgi:hypothetical protein
MAHAWAVASLISGVVWYPKNLPFSAPVFTSIRLTVALKQYDPYPRLEGGIPGGRFVFTASGSEENVTLDNVKLLASGGMMMIPCIFMELNRPP